MAEREGQISLFHDFVGEGSSDVVRFSVFPQFDGMTVDAAQKKIIAMGKPVDTKEDTMTRELGIVNISGVECYERDGVVYLKLETVARGLGFTNIAPSGNEVVRWARVEGYLRGLGVTTCGHDGFIPENVFYRLAMKAKNAVAEAFQAKIADEVIPSIRKHGAYMTPEMLEKVLLNPDTIIQLATALKEEQEKRKALESDNARLSAENAMQKRAIAEFQPIRNYVDEILSSSGTMVISQIAADYGMSALRLNKILHEEGIQRKINGQWILYKRWMGKGYTDSKTVRITHTDGKPDVKVHTVWTQKGRLLIHEILSARGIRAVMDSASA